MADIRAEPPAYRRRRRGLSSGAAFRLLAALLPVLLAGGPAPVLAEPSLLAHPALLAQAEAQTPVEDPLRAKPRPAGERRYASLRSDEVNVRVGPGVRYPVKWVFRQKAMPVEVVQEYDTWRKIRDWEGAEGWVHRAMLSSKRSVIVTGPAATLRRRQADDSPAVARLARGVVAELESCGATWCQVTVDGYDGWIRRDGLWGLREGETLP